MSDGAGYIGGRINDELKKPEDGKDFKSKLDELKVSYDELKKEFVELKTDFQDAQKTGVTKVNKLNKEITTLKEDYKICMKAMQDETFQRNKAETMVRVLRDTIETSITMKNVVHPQNRMKESNIVINDEVEEQMDTEEDDEWVRSTRLPKKSRTNMNNKEDEINLNCDICDVLLTTKQAYMDHIPSHVVKEPLMCQKCQKCFKVQSELNEHEELHGNKTGDRFEEMMDTEEDGEWKTYTRKSKKEKPNNYLKESEINL